MATSESVIRPVVVVTGSSGLVGQALVRKLCADYAVVGLDVKAPGELHDAADWIECDLTDDASLQRAVATMRQRFGSHLASIIHLAAYFSGEPNPMYDELTIQGTRRLAQSLLDFDVQQLVFASSLWVMKPVEAEDEILTESSQTDPAWAYPKSKLIAETFVQLSSRRMPTVVLRIAGVYDEDCNSIPLSQHISRIYEKKLESYFFPGKSSQVAGKT
jgi:nucleoside-diphosphate-sugar epimerase